MQSSEHGISLPNVPASSAGVLCPARSVQNANASVARGAVERCQWTGLFQWTGQRQRTQRQRQRQLETRETAQTALDREQEEITRGYGAYVCSHNDPD